MYERSFDNKFDPNLSVKQIAEKYRADIKALVKEGFLPKIKYTVRCESFPGGAAIDVGVLTSDDNAPDLIACLQRLLNSYNRENGKRFYSDIRID